MSPIVPVLGGVVGLVGLLLAFRKGGGQTPDPAGVAPIYMQGAAGKRQYEMRRIGPGYAWTIKGDKNDNGSDAVSGNAIVQMFESLYTGNNADTVTGHVAKGSAEGIAGSFSVVETSRLKWNWIVNDLSDASKEMGSGIQTSRGAATIAALNAIEPFTDWIVGLPTLQGGVLEPKPQGEEPPGETPPGETPPGPHNVVGAYNTHGIIISATSVTAYDLPQWLDWAGPIVAAGIQAGDDASAIHEALGLHNLDPDVRFTGKTHTDVIVAMHQYLEQWKQGKYLELDSVQRTVAAAAIGAKIALKGKKGYVKEKPVIVVETAFRKFSWYVWNPGNRRGTQFAVFEGQSFALNKAWNEAVNAAAGPETVQGGGAPIQECDTSIKVSELSQLLPAVTFLQKKEKEIKLWSPPSIECQVYTLQIGVCLLPSGGGSFGELDYYTEGLGAGDQPSRGDAAEWDFGIDRHPAYEAPMDWHLFEVPLAWKRQREIRIIYLDGVIEIDNTKSIDTPEGDACPDRARRWPGLGDDHYVVQTWKKKLGEPATLVPNNWTSQPELELFTQGKNLFARVQYGGLPSFKAMYGQPSVDHRMGADANVKNSFTIGFKIRAKGGD